MITDLQRQLGIDSSFFWQLLVFLVVFVWLRVVYFSPFLKLIQRRESQSDGLSEEAQKMEEESTRLETQYKEAMATSRKKAAGERDALLVAARKEASAVVAQARVKAKEKIEQAREGAAKSADSELAGLKSQVGAISSLLVEKLTHTKVGL